MSLLDSSSSSSDSSSPLSASNESISGEKTIDPIINTHNNKNLKKNKKDKKSKKDKKEKKDKKHKKDKKEKRDQKNKKDKKKIEKGERNPNQKVKNGSANLSELGVELTSEEIKEINDFKRSVQGNSKTYQNNLNSDKFNLNQIMSSQTKETLAESLGISKGLIRTSDQDYSLAKKYTNQYSDQDDNPAKRQRLKRELTAQRAIEKARKTIEARSITDQSNLPNFSSLDKFCSSNKK
jgi:hypothetical protein